MTNHVALATLTPTAVAATVPDIPPAAALCPVPTEPAPTEPAPVPVAVPALAPAPRRRAWRRIRARRASGLRSAGQAGQATAEYALVLLGVAAIALLVTAWAAKSGKIAGLFDAVMDQLISKVR